MPFAPLLGRLWLAVGIHLWQTSLVLALILLLSRWMRSAPARVLHTLWSIALLKVLLPVSLFADLAKRLSVSPSAATSESGRNAGTATLDAVYAVLRPEGVVEALRSRLDGSLALLPVVFTILWVFGVAYVVVRLVGRKMATATERPAPFDLVPDAIREKLGLALRGSSIPPKCIRVNCSSALPHVVGMLRPRIVIPVSLIEGLRPAELRSVLLHEDLHRRRRDPLRGAMFQLLGTVLFFYPLVGVLLRRLQDATELVCDERVVRSGVGGDAYARALAKTLKLGLFPATQPFAAGVGGGSLLRVRFERISTPRRYSIMTRHRIIVGAAVALVLAGAFLPTRLVAGDSGKEAEKAKAPGAVAKGEMLQLDKLPVPLKQVPPVYPEQEKKDGITGEVHLRLHVNAVGLVDTLATVKEVEGHPAFATAATIAARQWTFKPGEIAGKPVDCWIQVPFKFRLN
jgi:TonB family protein